MAQKKKNQIHQLTDGLSRELVDGIAIYRFSGQTVSGTAIIKFGASLRDSLSQGRQKFVVSFIELDLLDLDGCSMAVSARRAVQRAGGKIVLCNIEKAEDEYLISRLSQLFDHFPMEEKAIAFISK
ncbi:MAG: STAS domain-containing protein [Patescibacteria group bacterium]